MTAKMTFVILLLLSDAPSISNQDTFSKNLFISVGVPVVCSGPCVCSIGFSDHFAIHIRTHVFPP